MRIIKFRAWAKEVKVMHPVWLSTEDEDGKYILMQFTGLKDKNGKEIYEGDIVKVLEKGTWYTAEVRYGLVGFAMNPLKANPFFARLYFTESENGSGIDSGVEVVGNIWENPELLNQNKYIN